MLRFEEERRSGAPRGARDGISTVLDLLWRLTPPTLFLSSCILYSRPTVRVFSPEGSGTYIDSDRRDRLSNQGG